MIEAMRERRLGTLRISREWWFARRFLSALCEYCTPLAVEYDLASDVFLVTAASTEFKISPKHSTIHPAYGARIRVVGPADDRRFYVLGFVEGGAGEIVEGAEVLAV